MVDRSFWSSLSCDPLRLPDLCTPDGSSTGGFETIGNTAVSMLSDVFDTADARVVVGDAAPLLSLLLLLLLLLLVVVRFSCHSFRRSLAHEPQEPKYAEARCPAAAALAWTCDISTAAGFFTGNDHDDESAADADAVDERETRGDAADDLLDSFPGGVTLPVPSGVAMALFFSSFFFR